MVRRQEIDIEIRANGNRGRTTLPVGGQAAVVDLLDRGLSRPLQPTDYDTSWALRLVDEDGAPAYPHLLAHLLDRQREDGGWGSRAPHAYDRVLSTLAVVVALSRLDGPGVADARAAGERYLREHAGDLSADEHRTIGFELILPALAEEASERGLDLPYAALGRYEAERAAKLALLPRERLFRTHTTALFSLESFRRDLDVEGAAGLLLENGSMVGSPSATAYLLSRVQGWREALPRSAEYLDALLAPPGRGLPAVHPCDVFVRAWALYYMQHGGLLGANRELLAPHLDYLHRNLGPNGVGFAASSGFVDSDDTAITLLVLHRAGYDVGGEALLGFEQDRWFSVHRHESNPSVSANLHILEALPVIPEAHRERVAGKILSFLLSARREGAYWRDKWHASAYYPTTRALMLIAEHEPGELEPTLEWVLQNQRPDGSWGQYMPTTEETSLALLALLQCHRGARVLPEEPLRRAAAYLVEHGASPAGGHPELWIGKALYAPDFAIDAVRLSALALYADTFGTIP